MPFSFNLRNFGRFSRQPSLEKPFLPTGGLAPAYDGPGGPDYNALPPPTTGSFMSRQQIRKATRPRLGMSALTSLFLFIVVVFLIMVEIGSTYDKAVLRDIWFLKLDLADLASTSDGSPGLGYGIGEAIGFSDFYQVGLWGYCQGMNSTGMTGCTKPDSRYWFDPVQMFDEQLYTDYQNGSVSLPDNFYDSLDEIKVCSHWMFGLFMAGACLSFVLIPAVLAGVKSRWMSLGLSIITFLNMICVLAATIIATVLFVVIKKLFRDYEEILDLVPRNGPTMFAMMWIAAAFSIFAFLIQVFLSCFCASERDIRLGKKKGKMQAFL